LVELEGHHRLRGIQAEQLGPPVDDLEADLDGLSVPGHGLGELFLEDEIELFGGDVAKLEDEIG
jgi:hypothetical protein